MLFFIAGVAFFVVVMVVKLNARSQIFDLGYRISLASGQKRKLIQEKKRLEVEIQYLRSPAVAGEKIKNKLDMKIPSSNQIVRLRSSRQ